TYEFFGKLTLPRHTSYPAVPAWSEEITPQSYEQALTSLQENPNPVSLYVHIPFCEKLCHYCACTKIIIPKSNEASGDYVSRLMAGLRAEIAHVRSLTGPLKTAQLHFGGGTPTYLE